MSALAVEREAEYDDVPERAVSATVVASPQPFPLEAEFVEQVECRLVVREYLGCELVDASATSPLDGRCDQPRADAAAAPCPGHAETDLGRVAFGADRCQVPDDLACGDRDQHQRPRRPEPVF